VNKILCENCGRILKPVVAVDIDGTLGEYHEHFVQFAQDYMDLDYPMEYDGSMEFSEYLGMEKHVYRDVKLAYRQGGMKRTMPLRSGARSFMSAIHDMGYETWIATTRPWDRLDNVDPDTREWLRRNHLPYDRLIYGVDKWEQLIDNVGLERITFVIDDLREECIKADHLGLVAFQLATDHNRGNRWTSGVIVDFKEAARLARINQGSER
jgi:5'(3')-deoxyribonucleotidase